MAPDRPAAGEGSDPGLPARTAPPACKVIVVMPAYNASETLRRTFEEMPPEAIHETILVDDASTDDTVARARALGIDVLEHAQNRGYGGNQKTCYAEALRRGADIVIMLHPDYQYDPRLIPMMILPLRLGMYDIMLGSRVRTRRECLDAPLQVSREPVPHVLRKHQSRAESLGIPLRLPVLPPRSADDAPL
jgi:glycosyltransferase involved in cell wall biosynthesis